MEENAQMLMGGGGDERTGRKLVVPETGMKGHAGKDEVTEINMTGQEESSSFQRLG
jgi:hypothetical protein